MLRRVRVAVALPAAAAAAIALLPVGPAGPRRTRTFFAFAPQLALLGSLNFDLVAVAFLTAAVVAARTHDDDRASLALGLGTTSKLFPLAAAPIAVARAA